MGAIFAMYVHIKQRPNLAVIVLEMGVVLAL